MTKYLKLVTMGLLFFMLSMGVIAQITPPDNDTINAAIQNGIRYLDSKDTWGNEIIALNYLDNRNSSYNFRPKINDRINGLLDSDYPLRAFLLGEDINRSLIQDGQLDDPIYFNFITQFECEELTQRKINDLLFLVDDDENDSGGYKSAHGLIILEEIRNDYDGTRCLSDALLPNVSVAIDEKILEVESRLVDREIFDEWVERAAVLTHSGYDLSDEDVQYILDRQEADGGWKNADYYDTNDTSTHTTALAVWALIGELT